MDRVRVGTAIFLIVLFTVSVFTTFPRDTGTRTVLGALATLSAGFMLGPTILGRKENKDA